MDTNKTQDGAMPQDADSKNAEAADVSGGHGQQDGVLYVGIDLGTSRSAIAASNGVREFFPSVVGYPKDVVAQKLLKKDKLFGDEAFEKRLSLNFYRPLEKGIIKHSDNGTSDPEGAAANLQAASDIIQEAIRRARPRSDELVYAVIGCPAQSSIQNKKAIIDAARPMVDSVMICSEPFAVAYGMDRLDDMLVIDIGAGTVDLCRMHGTLPDDEDQLTLETAGDYVDNLLFEALKERCTGAQFTLNMVKNIKEQHGFIGERTDPVIVDLPVAGKPTPFDVTDPIRESCRAMVPPIVDALGQLVASFDPEFQSRLKGNVLLGGGGSMVRGLAKAVQAEMHERLGEGTVLAVEEPVYAGSNGALKIAHDMPAEFWEQLK